MSRRGVLAGAVLVLVCVLAPARPSAAQVLPPGYPGPTTTVPAEPTSEEQDGGRVRSGQTVVIESCGFAPTSAEPEVAVEVDPVRAEADLVPEPVRLVSVTWNGQVVGTSEVGEDGCASVTVEVHDRDDQPPCPAVVVDGTEQAGNRGANELVVSGEGANGAARTVTTSLSISCSNGNGAGTAPAAGAQDEGVGDQGVRASLTLDDEPLLISATRSPIVRWGGLNVLLLALAGGLLLAERRRRARRAVL